MRLQKLFPNYVPTSDTNAGTRPARRNMARIDRDGNVRFQLKPLSADQIAMVRQMVIMGHGERAIARAIGRSHQGVQRILRRLGLKTIHKVRLEAKNAARRQSIETHNAT